jgi:serine/threonine protein phosphatase PrpC
LKPLPFGAAGLDAHCCVRERNEDAVLVDWRRRAVLVADGMGGTHGGESLPAGVELLP